MLTKNQLKNIIQTQNKIKKRIIKRDLKIPQNTNRIIIITGIRRCGKSTILNETIKKGLKINFEDPRLEDFEIKDFFKLEEINETNTFIFDEIQNIENWETYVRSAYERNKKIFITGSNARLLSKELGTKLTGRQKSIELFPFNYKEYLRYNKKQPQKETLISYLQEGGLPEYLENKDKTYHRDILKDIILKDIAVRREIKNEKNILRLAIFLMSNISKELSYNNISKILNIKSVRTTIDYTDYLEDSYLIQKIPMYSKSIKKQIVNPKKIYSMDLGIAQNNSISFSEDTGRKLENAVFLHLRQKYKEILYFKENNSECDFLIREQEKITKAIQVTLEINETNIQREINGLKKAMQTVKTQGVIITLDQEDEIEGIKIIPAWKFFLEE
jgi:uncharacterized protein